jgi:hypothetical protein
LTSHSPKRLVRSSKSVWNVQVFASILTNNNAKLVISAYSRKKDNMAVIRMSLSYRIAEKYGNKGQGEKYTRK